MNQSLVLDELPICKEEFTHESRTLNHEDKSIAMPYKRRKGEFKSLVHWGQRKLLMSEIEFLANFGQPNVTLLYAGAAPGTHINYLSNLFPDINFVLVDPSPFTAKEIDKIKIINGFFDDDLCRQYCNQQVLFISDIRTADSSKLTREDTELYIEKDQVAQARWHRILRPLRSMLKFRLPYGEGKTKYLDGDIYLPVWGPITTSETRLIVPGPTDSHVVNENKSEESNNLEINQNTNIGSEVGNNTADDQNWCLIREFDNMLNVLFQYSHKSHLL